MVVFFCFKVVYRRLIRELADAGFLKINYAAEIEQNFVKRTRLVSTHDKNSLDSSIVGSYWSAAVSIFSTH